MQDEFTINVKEFVQTYLGLIFKVGLALVVLSALFLFTNLTTEFYDTPKFLILLAFTGLMLILLTLKFTLTGKVVLVRTPLDIPLLLLLAVGIVSTILSPSPYVALLGNQLKIHGSLVSLVALVLFYFVLTNNLKNLKNVNWVFNLALIAGAVLAALSLLAFSGVKILPPPFSAAINFTTTGSGFSTTAILALLLPFIVMQILTSTKPLFLILYSLFLLLSGAAIALTGNWATWVGAAFGFAVTLFLSDLRNLGNLKTFSQIQLVRLIGLAVPVVLVTLVTVISVIPPLGAAKNPLYVQAKNLPREVQLPFVTSWKISVSAFRDSPFWGTGPATYAFGFTNYKPVEFNSLKIWNLRFDSSFNEYLQTLATLGGFGLLALLSLAALFISATSPVILSAAKNLSRMRDTSNETTTHNNQLALAVSGLTFFIILALHPSSLPLWIIGILILASFIVISREDRDRLSGNRTGLNDLKDRFLRIAGLSVSDSTETIKMDALPGVLLTISLALVLFAFFFGGKITLADYHHRLALNAVVQNQGIIAYNELIAAEKLNPVNDLYRTDLAQVNFALANAIASAKGPTEASPTGSLTDQDKQNIQVLLQQSINEGKTAVTLSPKSSLNWEILALLYRQIAGVAQNALVFSLDAYGRAIFQDPLNPTLRVNAGGVYYAVKNYDLAIRFFTDAINLKPDFPNAYYNLSVALKDKGDLNSAKSLAEKLLTLIDKSSPDYKIASDYLEDLKNKTASEAQPPAASAKGALQQNQLPKVVDVGNPPEKIATPEAIKKPEASSTPTATPTPIASPTTNP